MVEGFTFPDMESDTAGDGAGQKHSMVRCRVEDIQGIVMQPSIAPPGTAAAARAAVCGRGSGAGAGIGGWFPGGKLPGSLVRWGLSTTDTDVNYIVHISKSCR